MDPIHITRRQAKKLQNVHSGAVHQIQVKTRYHGSVVEVEDAHFHHDSAVLLPDYGPFDDPDEEDDRVTGLSVLRACYVHGRRNPDQLMLVAGHTDTSGTKSYNRVLSKRRALNVYYALRGDRSRWVESCLQHHKVEDYQLILKWVDHIWSWGCDPGPIDGKSGPKTQEATRTFQSTYNREMGGSLVVNGVVGASTWGAFFDVYSQVLQHIIPTDAAGLAAMRAELRFVRSPCESIGCGEEYPIDQPHRDNYRSPANRRVEIVFFDPGEEPVFLEEDAAACADLYTPGMYQFKPVDVPKVPLTVTSQWVVRILKPGNTSLDERDPVANMVAHVTYDDGTKFVGMTDSQGILRVPVLSESARLRVVVDKIEIEVNAGALPRMHEGDAAIKKRLHNMGFGTPDVKTWDQAAYEAALRSFQEMHELPVTGLADAITRAEIERVHGS